MKKIKDLVLIGYLLVINLYLVPSVFGQNKVTNLIRGVDGGVGDNLETWIPGILNFLIGLAALICVAVLIASGYMYITAAGDQNKVEKANKSLTYAIVGLVICFISVILVEFVLKNILEQGATSSLNSVYFFLIQFLS